MWGHGSGQVVLGRLQGEERGRALGMAETGVLDDQRPEEIHGALGQAADGEDGHLPTGGNAGPAQGVVVWCSQRALRHDDEDRITRDAGCKQVQEPPNGSGGLAARVFHPWQWHEES